MLHSPFPGECDTQEPIPKAHCICISNSSPLTTAKAKPVEDASPPSVRARTPPESSIVDLPDPCPEAREKLQDMCRHM